MRVVLDPAAAAELREAAVFYEDCREGLGQEFLTSVEAASARTFDMKSPSATMSANKTADS
ncbi:MAG: hypothetical protein NTX53_05110 [candidate division WOR-3 bacterium]|nr:hypothetical protein [candidate division WOR-3 bacterium]